ncbi:MAG: hypothetical protein KKI12_07390 [Proteobacteria bacterium]|nr:hypothetical protein [Pseudomonadota bacterium]MBU4287977.1 hypothetical protein [Pseudomonadota bacterium]MBU4414147.1 hypothetical protein [Pseudomonadota bacterium]MCG2757171.1 hypothetical protein [Desulfobacteraceae bacterium]
MKKSLILILSIIFSIVLYGQVKAKVTGLCSNCHTMHNSQGGADMADYGSANPEAPGTGPKESLTRGTCFGCHGQVGALNIKPIESSDIPQVYHTNTTDLAAGNFYHITKVGGSDTFGHNVKQLANVENTGLSTPPGDENTTGIDAAGTPNFTCAGAYGCHGDRSVTGDWAAMKGAHHTDDGVLKFGSISEAGQGGSVGLSYRFLYKVKGGEDSDWQATSGAADHNEYKGASDGVEATYPDPGGNTISGLCAECHGNFHGPRAVGSDITNTATGSPWLRHPSDIVLPNSGEYSEYNTPNTGSYSLTAPLARQAIPDSALSGISLNSDVIMCLSCHGAHATNYYKLMRWDYASDTLLSPTPVPTDALYGCIICHTSKN